MNSRWLLVTLSLAIASGLAGWSAACRETPSSTGTSATASATPDPATTNANAAPAPASATVAVSASASAGTAIASATPSATPSASAGAKGTKLAIVGSAAGSAAMPVPAAQSAAPPIAVGSPVRFQKVEATYKLEASPPASCSANAPCEVPVRLEAIGAYHINKDYPYKLKTEPTAGVTFETSDGSFSKAGGHFSQQGESVGVMKVRFTGTQAGQAKIRGVYKFSVCSASDCKLEQATVAFETPIRQ